jgi:hypothetical protein
LDYNHFTLLLKEPVGVLEKGRMVLAEVEGAFYEDEVELFMALGYKLIHELFDDSFLGDEGVNLDEGSLLPCPAAALLDEL